MWGVRGGNGEECDRRLLFGAWRNVRKEGGEELGVGEGMGDSGR